MRKDIYVVQKTAEEGKHLEDWCIENYIPISSSRFVFDESWKLFVWHQTLQDGFLANQNIKINKQDLTQVTIEEFKRLQLESLGKTDLKPGDYITVTDESVRSEFKMIGKVTEVRSDNDESNIRGKADFIYVNVKEFKSNSLWCYRDNGERNYRKSTKEEIEWLNECIRQGKFVELSKPEFIIGKWYKWANKTYPNHHYFKLDSYNTTTVFHKERIHHRKYEENESNWSIKEVVRCDLSEIQEYLPDGHIDRQIQTNDKWLIEQAKRLYPIGTKIYQLYSGGTSNKSHEITIHNHDFTIDSDGEVLYNGQYRLYTPINDTWATKVEEQPKYEVVHCKTQEEWDFVKNKIPNSYAMIGEPFHEDCAICILEKSYADLIYWQQQNAKILSFEEWLNKEGITIEKETEYKVGDVVIATGNIKGYEILKGRIIGTKASNCRYLIDYSEFNPEKLGKIWSNVHKLVDEKQNESLVGRWVKTKEGKYLLLTKSENNGGYYVNYTSDFIDLHFINRPTELKSGYELMPEGFIPTTILEKPSLDFSQLNLEDWLRETKKLNLDEEQLQNHISSSGTCSQNVGLQLKGNTIVEKAEILWNEWNPKEICIKYNGEPGIGGEIFGIILSEEWGQNKYVIGIDPYKTEPNTNSHKAELIKVNKKQIFKN